MGKKEDFTLLQLAYLWEDYEPAGYPLPDYIRARFDRLADDAKAKKLILNHGDDLREILWEAHDQLQRGKTASPDWTASRKDAKAYARLVDERPKFLFPMERID